MKRDLRRNITLSQQLSMEPESPVNPIQSHQATGSWDGATIRSASGRTLFDIIQQDDNWKPVKDRLRLQRVGAAFSDGAPVDDGAPSPIIVDGRATKMSSGGASSIKRNPMLARTISRSVSVRPMKGGVTGLPQPGDEIVITEITDVTDEIEDEPEKEPAKGGLSLMALLEQSDNRMMQDDEHGEDDDDEDEDEEETDGDEEKFHTCCICMVRHKGSAFVSCGHTFCRLCSRELWISHENCPLCNSFIQEILEIF